MTTTRLLAALGLLTAVSTGATLLSPALAAEQPLLLAGLSPRVPFLALAAGDSPLPLFLLVGLGRLLLADPIHYALGRRHGAHRVGARVQRVVGRFGLVAVAIRPNGPVLAAAGAGHLRPGPVLVADVAGTVAYLLLLRGGVQTFLG